MLGVSLAVFNIGDLKKESPTQFHEQARERGGRNGERNALCITLVHGGAIAALTFLGLVQLYHSIRRN